VNSGCNCVPFLVRNDQIKVKNDSCDSRDSNSGDSNSCHSGERGQP
jgi:hypothetical protein